MQPKTVSHLKKLLLEKSYNKCILEARKKHTVFP